MEILDYDKEFILGDGSIGNASLCVNEKEALTAIPQSTFIRCGSFRARRDRKSWQGTLPISLHVSSEAS